MAKKNLGVADRIVRLIGGVILIYLGYALISNNFLRVLLVIIGVVGVIESIISYCYIYNLFGINTCKKG